MEIGVQSQILRRNIAKTTLVETSFTKGTNTQANYGKDEYSKTQNFILEIKPNVNDAGINPAGVNFDRPREVLTQSYSFSSIALQLGFIYQL